METYGLIVAEVLRFATLPSAILAVAVLLVKLRKEVPFVRITEVQQLEAARLLRQTGTSDGAGELHPYEKGVLYRILAKSRFVSMREMDLLLKFPDPYQYIDRLTTTKRFLDRREVPGEPVFQFVRHYRRAWCRRIARTVVTGVYIAFALLAIFPMLATSFYHMLYVPHEVSVEEFSGVSGYLLSLLVFTVPFFGSVALADAACGGSDCGLGRIRVEKQVHGRHEPRVTAYCVGTVRCSCDPAYPGTRIAPYCHPGVSAEPHRGEGTPTCRGKAQRLEETAFVPSVFWRAGAV